MPRAVDRRELAPGVVLIEGFLDLDAQRALVARCRELEAACGMYTPVVRGGRRMRLRMLCLGRHWNALTYRYEAARTDFDGRLVPPLPDDLAALARRAAAEAGMPLDPDICLVNYYDEGGRLGLHQDKDESPEAIASGAPVVSISVGDTAKFLLGGLRRRDPVEALWLRSGDALVFGGPARLRYHGVARILPGTAPPGLELSGRYNLSFRRY
ncbi:MAG TPA: alpha-ketoglutarate-dependent dioxygenase AlkB [Vicinamibacterales bacterium]|nr:alpha-ketoglutarate-dependent dioxygenase AlkB [Vicinamibacterales bacterium]